MYNCLVSKLEIKVTVYSIPGQLKIVTELIEESLQSQSRRGPIGSLNGIPTHRLSSGIFSSTGVIRFKSSMHFSSAYLDYMIFGFAFYMAYRRTASLAHTLKNLDSLS